MTICASSDRVRRLGGWLPERQDDLEEWIAGHRERVEARGEDAVLHPVIVEFKELIASDPVVRLYMSEMIEQVPKSKPYRKRHLTSVDQMLRLINEVLTTAPEFIQGGMVTTPLTAILDWTMGTEAGFAAHRDPRSALNYHRWHAPVAGTIVRAYVKDATYFSEADSEGADAVEPTLSQSYLAHVAARAIILIQADDPVIGLMAVIPVGMVEVSSCVIGPEIVPGHHVNKGDELGYFQFGGSTECLVFRPGVIDQFALTAIPQPQDPNAPLVRVRSKLATARAEENA